jgi:general secretion pathway protein H
MPTSQARINRENGFTLIEILLVIAIIAFVIGIGIPRLSRSLGTQLRATTRKLVTLNREVHHSARLKNRTYRVVFDFGDKERKTSPSFYVESGSGRELAPSPDATPPSKFSRDKDKEPPPAFSPDTETLKKPVALPRGVQFEDVEIVGQDKPVTEGKAYVYFFPQGLVQKTIIHITDGAKIHWSLIINPLTGATEIRSEYIKLKDTEL